MGDRAVFLYHIIVIDCFFTVLLCFLLIFDGFKWFGNGLGGFGRFWFGKVLGGCVEHVTCGARIT